MVLPQGWVGAQVQELVGWVVEEIDGWDTRVKNVYDSHRDDLAIELVLLVEGAVSDGLDVARYGLVDSRARDPIGGGVEEWTMMAGQKQRWCT